MNRFLGIALLLGLAALFMLAVGCNDKATEPPVVKVDGDTLDAGYLIAQEAFGPADELSLSMARISLELIDSVTSDSANPAPSLSPHFATGEAVVTDSFLKTYHSDSKYWYFYAGHVETLWNDSSQVEDILTFAIIDSLQFRHSDVPVQWPVAELLTEVRNVCHYSMGLLTDQWGIDARQNLRLTGEVGTAGDVVFNATGSFDANFSNGNFRSPAVPKVAAESCAFVINLSNVFSDLAVNLTALDSTGQCPSSGNITHSGMLDIACSGDTTFAYNDGWMISQTYYGDSVQVVFENSTTRWSTTNTCGGSEAPTNPFAALARLSRR
jgi:hypothetical protein